MFDYDRLKEAIQNSGKKKKYLCEKMGKPPYYLRDVIKQKNKIPEDLQKILAEELFVTVEWLNGADDSIYPHGYRALNKANEEIAKLSQELDKYEKKPVPTDGDGLLEKIIALDKTPGLLEVFSRFLELATEHPENAKRFLAFAVQELESDRTKQ